MKFKMISILLMLFLATTASAAKKTQPAAKDEGAEAIAELDTGGEDQEQAKKPEGPKSLINNSYIGLNLIYNTATLSDPALSGNGYGADVFFESYISNPWSYKVIFGFSYNPFSYDVTDTFSEVPYPLNANLEEKYTKDETFFNYSVGFTFEYNLLFKETFGIQSPALQHIVPYFYTGMLASFLYYKVNNFTYATPAIEFSDTGSFSKDIPAALGIPLGAGIKFLAGTRNVISAGFNYTLFRYESENNVGYKNRMDIKLGYSRGLFGK